MGFLNSLSLNVSTALLKVDWFVYLVVSIASRCFFLTVMLALRLSNVSSYQYIFSITSLNQYLHDSIESI